MTHEPDTHLIDRESLEPEYAEKFRYRWLIQYPDGRVVDHRYEADAAKAQRRWRYQHNLDPMTGEPKVL